MAGQGIGRVVSGDGQSQGERQLFGGHLFVHVCLCPAQSLPQGICRSQISRCRHQGLPWHHPQVHPCESRQNHLTHPVLRGGRLGPGGNARSERRPEEDKPQQEGHQIQHSARRFLQLLHQRTYPRERCQGCRTIHLGIS